MTQADSVHSTPPTNSSRRYFLSRAAGVAAGSAILGAVLPLPVSARASERVPDPILAAIEAHKVAYDRYSEVLERKSRLEEALPKELRRSNIDVWGASIVETDDPRWIEAEKAVDRLSNAETDAAIALVDVGPITLAGMSQLLDYILYRERRGDEWPGNLEDDAGKPRSWKFFLFEKLSATLRGMVA